MNSKIYSIDQKQYEVFTYYFDIKNSTDEETTIYFTEEYGVLILFNDGWMIMAGIFEYDNISLKLIETILSDSTNSFPLWRKRKMQLPTIVDIPDDEIIEEAIDLKH